MTGSTVTATRRVGKFLFIDLDDQTLIVHLRMSGQLIWRPKGWADPLPAHTHARLELDSDEGLHFIDPRTFGELWVTTPDAPELDHLGPDAFSDADRLDLRRRFKGRRGAIKSLLMNQTFVAGIGNIYADEILWRARIRSDEVPDWLSAGAADRVQQATKEVIATAVELRGSTLRDRQYVDLMGNSGRAQEMHRAYDREGEPCERCATPIARAKLGNRSAYFCPKCQRRIRKPRGRSS